MEEDASAETTEVVLWATRVIPNPGDLNKLGTMGDSLARLVAFEHVGI